MKDETTRVGGGTEAGAHLLPAARVLLEAPDHQRIRAIRAGSRIPYPQTRPIFQRLQEVLDQPPSDRAEGLTIYGPTNNGKTSLIRAFVAKQRASSQGHPDAESRDFVLIDTPPAPKLSLLMSELLRAVGDPRPDVGTADARLLRVLHMLPAVKPRMIVLDEIQNVLSGSGKQSEVFLNTLKTIANKLSVPLVLVGIETTVNVLRTDPQVENRFPSVELRRWSDGPDFVQFAEQVLTTLPLQKPTHLTPPLQERLYRVSDGLLGGLVRLLQRAACHAVESKIECINGRVLDAVDGSVARRGA